MPLLLCDEDVFQAMHHKCHSQFLAFNVVFTFVHKQLHVLSNSDRMGQCCVKPATTAGEVQPEQITLAPTPTQVRDQFGLSKHFETLRLLGEGGTGETWLMRDRGSKELVAVKMIKRPIPKALHKMLIQEVMIQRDLGEGHINIVSFKEVVLTPTHLAFVLEYISGGTLTKHVSDRWATVHQRGGLFLSEDEARYYFKVCTGSVMVVMCLCLAISFSRRVSSQT